VTTPATTIEQRYEFHGIGITASAGEPAVLGALEHRLADFISSRDGPVELRLQFGPPTGDPDQQRGRPVYDTPYGTLAYVPELDLLTGRVGDVQLRCEPGACVASFSCESFTGRNLYLATHPLTTIALMELLERRGLYSLHAGCLAERGRHDDGVLLAGPSGAGKSTLALALARGGMSFLSDDVIFLGVDEGRVNVFGFADAIGVTDKITSHFPELAQLAPPPSADGFPKRLVRIEQLFGGTRAVAACEPRALVFPRVTPDQPSSVSPLPPGEALLRLTPDVLLTDTASTQEHLAAIATLLGQVRCYELCSGHDLTGAASLVRSLVTS
jgi:hypothetical protein